MKRRLFNLAAGFSLVLSLIASAGWVRSYFVWDFISWFRSNSYLFEINSFKGQFVYQKMQGGSIRVFQSTMGKPDVEFKPPMWRWYRTWAQLTSPNISYGFTFQPRTGLVGAPYWFLILVTALLPAIRLARWRMGLRRRRLEQGCCTKCGYDLRATPDRCPECGTIPQARTASGPV